MYCSETKWCESLWEGMWKFRRPFTFQCLWLKLNYFLTPKVIITSSSFSFFFFVMGNIFIFLNLEVVSYMTFFFFKRRCMTSFNRSPPFVGYFYINFLSNAIKKTYFIINFTTIEMAIFFIYFLALILIH